MSRLEARLARLERELAVNQQTLVVVETAEDAEQYADDDSVFCVITGVPSTDEGDK
ncbi:hypothetical protein D3C78_573280 [compost metagenome]